MSALCFCYSGLSENIDVRTERRPCLMAVRRKHSDHWERLWRTLHMHTQNRVQPRGFVYSLIRELRLYQGGLLCGMPWQQIINELMNQTDALRFTSRAANSKTPPNCTHTHTHTLLSMLAHLLRTTNSKTSRGQNQHLHPDQRDGGRRDRPRKKYKEIKQLQDICSL